MDHKTTGNNLSCNFRKPHDSTRPLKTRPPARPNPTLKGKKISLTFKPIYPLVKVYSNRVSHPTCFVYLQ